MKQPEHIIREIQKGLLKWYGFRPDSRALYIGSSEDALAEMLSEQRLHTVCVPAEQASELNWVQAHAQSFDYIVSVRSLEQQENPCGQLRAFRELLKADGTLLLGMNNRFGLRYFCGDRDPHTGRNFDGIEGYRRAYGKKEDTFQGRCYSMAEMKQMLEAAGWPSYRFFSVLPGLEDPCLIYAEDCLPNEGLANRLFPTYHCPETVFLEEESLYTGLAENGMFHQMANAYLIECTVDAELSDIVHVTGSMERGEERAFFTILRRGGAAEKRAAYPQAQVHLERLAEHGRDLAAHGIPVVDAEIEDGVYRMPYRKEESGQLYLERLLQTDKDRFLEEMDRFREQILQSSEMVKLDAGDGEGAILRKGYLDMVPLNSFRADGAFLFYDQEFCEENYPANAIVFRMIATFYAGNILLQKFLPMDMLFERYGLRQKLEKWQKMEWEFLAGLRNEKPLRAYHETYRRDAGIVNENRQRMNYSTSEYQRLFVDIFHNADTRRLVLFGSGNFAKRFLELYSQDYPVCAVIDNNEAQWGRELEGITIQPPQFLKQFRSGEYKVLICIKNYTSVMKQLDAMGVTEYGIYDTQKAYPRKRRPTVSVGEAGPAGSSGTPKKYHTGYIAGVFDLYHIGHLNMFKRAKEQCDYLIAGVVSDEGVRQFKGVEPFVCFEERMEMVRSCRYVDEAVEIPLHFGGTRDAWRLYHFACQFSGSDYAENPDWLAEKEFLEKHGAEMVFFPYTESTSSSKLKALIEKKLI